MFNNLYISTVIFVISMQGNFHTTHATSSVSQENITKTSFTQGNITKTSFTHGNISGRKRRIPMGDKRISGGTVLKPNSWPYLVKLFSEDNDTHGGHCGATVYNESFIITAAHCVYGYTPEKLRVTAGEHSTAYTEKTEQWRQVSEIIIHPGYNDFKEHDIALLKLGSPLLFLKTAYVTAIEINTDMSCPAPNDNCSSAGWGMLSENEDVQELPSEVVLSVMSIPNCQLVNALIYRELVSDIHICAGDSKSGKSICKGDSGGALVCNCGGRNKLAGVVSLIEKCGSQLYPGIYTRISCYSEWIKYGSVNYLCKAKRRDNGSNILSLGNTIALVCVLYWCAPFLFTDHP